ncbi:MAG: protein-L-isoaspartate(D-aspartate) O-methyltransferase [Bacteroidota bacterium]|nr:protein-L-isoaspartate(D-aspartate) O-methyltransferase [Bacteroidota bacterium]
MREDWRFQRRRARLVEELRENGITNERVLSAIGSVQRHQFVEQALLSRAYLDEALPIGMKQTISQPFTVAYQSQTLDPQPGERILEIGTGSGYQAAVLAEMGARVFSIERVRGLYEKTAPLLRSLGYDSIRCRYGDGMQGWETLAPFDGIIVTAGALDVPDSLLKQLKLPEGMKPGGRMVIPVGGRDQQMMTYIVRMGEEAFDQIEMEAFRFVPLLGKTSDAR